MSIDDLMKQFADLSKRVNGVKTRDRARERYLDNLQSQKLYMGATTPINWFWTSKKYRAHVEKDEKVYRRLRKWNHLEAARVDQRSKCLESQKELAAEYPLIAAAFEAGIQVSDNADYVLNIFLSDLSSGRTNELGTLNIESRKDAEYFLKVLIHNQPGNMDLIDVAQLSLGMVVYERLVQPLVSEPLSEKILYFHGGIKGRNNDFLSALSAWDSLQLSWQ